MSTIPPEYDIDAGERERLEGLADAGQTAAVVETFKALTDPLRVTVLRMLDERTLCVCVLVELLDVEYSNLSYHLKVLRDADLVAKERDGSFAEYRLTDRGREIARLVETVGSDEPDEHA